MIDQRWIYFRLFYYVDQSNGSLIVQWLYKNWDFFSEDIEAFVHQCGLSFVGDLENRG